ncbi:hypothetical protein [Sphingobacterium bovistauri]|uniref:Lipocalin-like domain-containing protein n=1 Tax=Sphingobacterium bovistauri TaxID=2781959 RepID=A0ABS7Z9L6_9SPHI|nr:hypothetical protein [Sphingobacterium bovistauri]MCA5005399.1 hypothetical protein [Sphingobacterium bovistauri]
MNRLVIFLFPLLVFAACKKDSNTIQELESGVYKGTFRVDYDGKIYTASDIEVVLNSDKSYNSTGNNNPRIPAGGSGTYVLKDNIIIFDDKNPWTAEFDWGLILAGEYKITSSNKKLILKKTIKSNNTRTIYKYDLIKQ